MGQLYTVGAASVVTIPLDQYASSFSVQNLGPDTVFYRAGTTVSAGLNDGTLAPNAALTYTTTTAFLAQSSAARLYGQDTPPTTGGGGGSPSGAAGGDLAGTYPNPSIGATLRGQITGSEQSANKGAASGYAPLDGSSRVPAANSQVQSVAGKTGAVTLAEADVASLTADLAARVTNPMTTPQDVIVGGTAGAPGRLAVGANGQVLGVSGGGVGWIAPAGLNATPRLDVCGHSCPAAGGAVGGDQNAYVDRLGKLLGARRRANIANGGSTACWPTSNSSTDGGWSWVLNNFQPPNVSDGGGGYMPKTTVAVVHHGYEDLAALGSLTPGPMQEAIKTEISRYCSAALYEDSDASWAYTGTWTTVAAGANWVYSAGSVHTTTTLNDVATWNCPSDYPGNLIIAFGLAASPGTVGNAMTLTVGLTINGVAQSDIVLNLDKGGVADAENAKTNGIVRRVGRADQGFGASGGSGGIALGAGWSTTGNTNTSTSITNVASTANMAVGNWISGTGIPAGTTITAIAGTTLTISNAATATATGVAIQGAHQIKLTYKARSGTGTPTLAVDYAQIEADPLDGPVVVGPGTWRAISYSGFNTWTHGPSAGTDPLNDAAIATWNTAFQAALTDFPGRAIYVDVDGIMQKNVLAMPDGIHPSNQYHGKIAQAIYDAIVQSGYLTSRVRSRASVENLGIMDGGLWRPIGGAYGTAIGLAYQNSWVTYASVGPAPAYQKTLEGRVRLRGYVCNGSGATANVTAFGPGYTPLAALQFPVGMFTSTVYQIGLIKIDNLGNVAFPFNGVIAAGGFNHLDCEFAFPA